MLKHEEKERKNPPSLPVISQYSVESGSEDADVSTQTISAHSKRQWWCIPMVGIVVTWKFPWSCGGFLGLGQGFPAGTLRDVPCPRCCCWSPGTACCQCWGTAWSPLHSHRTPPHPEASQSLPSKGLCLHSHRSYPDPQVTGHAVAPSTPATDFCSAASSPSVAGAKRTPEMPE